MKTCLALIFALVGSGLAGQEARPASNPCWSTLFQQADNLRRNPQPRNLTQALDLFQQSLDCDPASLPTAQKAAILLDMGNVQLRLEANEQALASLSSALELFKQSEAPDRNFLKEQAFGLRDRGLALRRLQRIDDAFTAYREAQSMFHALNEKSSESRTLADIGLMTVHMGEHQAALDYYRQALEMSYGDAKQKGVVLDLIGRVYAQMNDLDLAQSYFQDALTLCRKTQYHLFIAYTLNDLGVVYVKLKKPRIAQVLHQEALHELGRYEPDDSEGFAETQGYLADAQSASGKYDAALQNYRQALSVQEKSGDLIGEAQTRVSLGEAATVLQDQDLALQSFIRASELYNRIHDRVGESNARFQTARIHALQGDYGRAQEQVENAIALAEEVRSFTPGTRLRTAYFASLEDMYRFQIELLLKQGPVLERQQRIAFETLQRAQSRALVEALASRMVPENLACESEMASRRNDLLAELRKQNQRMQLSIQERSGRSGIEDLFVSIRRLEIALEEIEAHCRAAQPRMEMLLAGAISLSEVQEQILDQESALFQFYLADPQSYVWVVTRSATQLICLPSKAWMELQAKRIVTFGPSGAWTPAQETALAKLWKKLLPALAVPGIHRWILVPDGAFHSFPFTFFSGKAGPGIEVVKIPSVSAIRTIRKIDQATKTTQLQLALFADPVFDAQDSRVINGGKPANNSIHGPPVVASRGLTRGSYARLLYSKQEAGMISRLVPRDQQLFLHDFDARLGAVTNDALNQFRMVHFATHSIVDDRHPDFSGIVFSLVARSGSRVPGFLFLKDIYRMKLHSDLVVLSSCVSALGPRQAGEGPMSLARGFLYAGSRAVVASLWEVDDEATAEFMGVFYRHMLKDKLAPSEALARTQAQFRHHSNRKLRNPYYWAGFELYGDWQTR